MTKHSWVIPDWPAPAHIKAVSTTRLGGVSKSPFDSLNLGTHVEDDMQDVLANRKQLVDVLELPTEPLWLDQVHSKVVANAGELDYIANNVIKADASISHIKNKTCIVMTADCLPVLFTNTEGTAVAAAHAGWRGLNDGILEATIADMQCQPAKILAWLGPAIGANAFEVGDEVRDAFMQNQQEAESAFRPRRETGKWLADIYKLARLRLQAAGVEAIYGGGYCTFTDQERFFSYRREGKTGRMASLIMMCDHEMY